MLTDAEVNRFIDMLRYEKRSSLLTCNAYRIVLERTLEVLNREFPELQNWSDVGLDAMRALVRDFNFAKAGSKLNRNSVAHSIYSLSSFFRFLVKENVIRDNPVKLVKVPKVKRHLPKILTLSEIELILKKEPETIYEVRDLTIVELLFSSGLRVSELTGLKLENYAVSSAEIKVLGKGGKYRIVPVGHEAAIRLAQYLKIRDQFEPKSDALFLNKYGEALTPRGVEQNLDKISQKAGVTTHLNPHKLRHSFASSLLQGKADLRSVQEMLGHASLAATQIYTHLDFEHLKSVYNSAHPLAKGHEK